MGAFNSFQEQKSSIRRIPKQIQTLIRYIDTIFVVSIPRERERESLDLENAISLSFKFPGKSGNENKCPGIGFHEMSTYFRNHIPLYFQNMSHNLLYPPSYYRGRFAILYIIPRNIHVRPHNVCIFLATVKFILVRYHVSPLH